MLKISMILIALIYAWIGSLEAFHGFEEWEAGSRKEAMVPYHGPKVKIYSILSPGDTEPTGYRAEGLTADNIRVIRSKDKHNQDTYEMEKQIGMMEWLPIKGNSIKLSTRLDTKNPRMLTSKELYDYLQSLYEFKTAYDTKKFTELSSEESLD